jgi:hypothetical protein
MGYFIRGSASSSSAPQPLKGDVDAIKKVGARPLLSSAFLSAGNGRQFVEINVFVLARGSRYWLHPSKNLTQRRKSMDRRKLRSRAIPETRRTNLGTNEVVNIDYYTV